MGCWKRRSRIETSTGRRLTLFRKPQAIRRDNIAAWILCKSSSFPFFLFGLSCARPFIFMRLEICIFSHPPTTHMQIEAFHSTYHGYLVCMLSRPIQQHRVTNGIQFITAKGSILRDNDKWKSLRAHLTTTHWVVASTEKCFHSASGGWFYSVGFCPLGFDCSDLFKRLMFFLQFVQFRLIGATKDQFITPPPHEHT